MDNEIGKILQLATSEGFFPTYQSKKGDSIVESIEVKVDNVGIHTFVVQKLLELEPLDPQIRYSFQKGLEFVINDAIEWDGRYLWRFLKNPPGENFLYPPDYDDTARARYIIELANIQGFDVPKKFLDFDFPQFVEEGITSNGEFTFVGMRPSNTTCPIVNANLLNSYSFYLRNKREDQTKNNSFMRLNKYLEKVVNDWEFKLNDFSRLSKFYLSHMFFAYLISEQADNFNEVTLNKIKEKVELESGNYTNPLESAWATSALINLGGDTKFIEKGIKQIEKSRREDGLWNAYPVYQHQRSQRIFGSSTGTSIFCVEARKKYDSFLEK